MVNYIMLGLIGGNFASLMVQRDGGTNRIGIVPTGLTMVGVRMITRGKNVPAGIALIGIAVAIMALNRGSTARPRSANNTERHIK